MEGKKNDWPEQEYPHKELTGRILAAAIAVHQKLGPGFVESIYENALVIELTKRGMKVRRQVVLPVFNEDQQVGEHRADLIVEEEVVVELKAVSELASIHEAQTKSTLKAAKLKVGLLINFSVTRLMDGVRRIVCTH